MTSPSIDIVVLNWNGGPDTVACLESLGELAYDNHRIVVVDNGSTDDSAAMIAARFPQLPLVRTGTNLGYAGGNNAGVDWCRANSPADFFLILNNDTTVDPSLLQELVGAAIAHPDIGVFGPKILFHGKPSVIWFAGARWSGERGDFFHVGYGEEDSDAHGDSVTSEYICGCALFVRRSLVERIGLFDTRYFLLYEEVDFCFRARRTGTPCMLVSRARVWHKISASMGGYESPLLAYFHARNRLLFAEAHFPIRRRLTLLWQIACEMVFPRLRLALNVDVPPLKRIYWSLRRRELLSLREYRSVAYRARIRAIGDYLGRRFGDCPPQIRIWKDRQRLDKAAAS